MKIAYTGWTWLVNHEDNHKWEFEQFLKEVADLGYEAVENFAFITKYFDNNAQEVKDLLEKYGLWMANLYEHYTDDDEKDYQSAVEYVDFMKKIGATYLNLQGVMWEDTPLDRPMDKEKILKYAKLSNRIGKLCKDNGCVACFHPHANTAIYKEEEIDFFLENTDPQLVTLCLDTAHTALAGMDGVE
ncbi:MAG: TIM barrel protein, partial [Clostridiales bacterium]|nr:TIM barrel protein [Clostridiales bacterium]